MGRFRYTCVTKEVVVDKKTCLGTGEVCTQVCKLDCS